jgi:chromate transporter
VTTDSQGAAESATLWEIFSGFLMIGMLGFGGIAASAQYVIVEKRRWLTPKDFVELFGICSVLPGGNFLNATVMIGDRYQGPIGAVVGLLALLLMPLLILLGIAVTYDHYSYLPELRAATAGAGSTTAGLIIGTAVRMGKGVKWGAWTIGMAVLTFVLVGLLRLPLWSIMLTLVPISVAFSLSKGRRS